MVWYEYLGHDRFPAPNDSMEGSYLGPAFDVEEIAQFLDSAGIPYECHDEEDALVRRVADLLADQKTVGWFQGRMEFGPRALGNRSILADPRGRDVQRTVNLKIKFRESFRPFAPSVLAERAHEYFDLDYPSPYMMMVAPVHGAAIEGAGLERLAKIDSSIPAVTHVDGSARIQTVHQGTNPLYHHLLKEFEERTGCPVLVNTSFNVRGEPIVCTPEEAYTCFRRTHMDALVLGPFITLKSMFGDAEDAVFSADEITASYGLD
jgi:carbamoyltransferase